MKSIKLWRCLLLFLIGWICFWGLSPVNSKADWGTATQDCMDYHGLTLHYGRYVPNASITLDGVLNETAWNHADVYDYIIPVMNMNQSEYHYIKYIHMKFLYDTDTLYFCARWDDDTIPQLQDKFLICWNINCTNYTVGMFLNNQSMETNQVNGRVDSWKWSCNNFPNYSQSDIVDSYFDDEGWAEDTVVDIKQARAGYSYEVNMSGEGYYQVEMKRSFSTSEPDMDAQFHLNSSTRFSIGVDNSLGSAEHAVSWTHELDFNNETIPEETSTSSTTPTQSLVNGYSLTWVLTGGVITLAWLSLYFRKRLRG